MKHKNISRQSGELLSYFNQKDQSCFNLPEAFKALPYSSVSAVKQLLSDMTQRGLLMRIQKGVYCIIPYERDPETFMPDWHLLAGYLIKNANYYIGYYSALQIHDLITQPSLQEQIVVSKQTRPSRIFIKDVPFQFIYHNEKHFFGINKMWIDNFHKVNCSDLEKTLIDALFKPNYAGGIAEIAKALCTSRDKINFDRLYDYLLRFDSQAVIKRLGFIIEILDLKHPIINKLQQIKTKSYVLLDPELPREGKMISRWSIQQNMDTETITSAIYT